MKTKETIGLMMLASILLAIISISVAAQCGANPTGETAVGLRNSSSYFLIFYIDELSMGGVPSGDRSVDFLISPGVHVLRADATIGTEIVSAWRTLNIPAGYVCTWTVVDLPNKPSKARARLQDSLRKELRAVVPLVIPN